MNTCVTVLAHGHVSVGTHCVLSRVTSVVGSRQALALAKHWLCDRSGWYSWLVVLLLGPSLITLSNMDTHGYTDSGSIHAARYQPDESRDSGSGLKRHLKLPVPLPITAPKSHMVSILSVQIPSTQPNLTTKRVTYPHGVRTSTEQRRDGVIVEDGVISSLQSGVSHS